jgi:hypothetical protein
LQSERSGIRSASIGIFDGAAAWWTERFDISERGQSDLVDGIFVSGGFFETLGVPPLIGRSISVADGP